MNLEEFYRLTRSLGSDVSRAALGQAFAQAEREIEGSWNEVWRKRLELVAAQMGIAATPYSASIKMVADLVQPGAIGITVAQVGGTLRWILLEDSSGGAVKIRDADESSPSRWVGESLLASELGWSSPEQLHDWVIWQQTLPCQGAVSKEAGAAGHQEHAHDESAHHGHHASRIPPLTRLLRILKPDRSDIWAAIWYSVGISILMLATPITIEALVSTATFGVVLQPLVVLSLVLLGCLLFAATLRAMQTYLVEILQRRIFIRVMTDLAQRLARVKVSEYDSNHGPELVNRFFDVLTVQKVSATLIMEGITIVLQATIGMIVVAFYHPILLALDLVLIGIIVFIIFGLGRGAISASIGESIRKYRVVEWLQELARHPVAFKLGGGSEYALQRADYLACEYLVARESAFRIFFRQIIASLLLQAVASTALLGVGGWLVVTGSLTLGQLIAAELILSAVVASFVKFGKHLESFYDLMAASDKLGHLIDLELERSTGEGLEQRVSGAAIEVRDVTFGYDPHHEVLRNYSLTLAAGEHVALDARHGHGRTTLTELLFGLRTPQHGMITIDGADYRDVRWDSLRQQIAVVSRIEIFDGSIAENVRMGRDTLLQGDLRQVLQTVGLLDAVLRLPRGLDTQLRTGGSPLSASQTQRLMLARALAGNPRLLVIDEILDNLATTATDPLIGVLFDPAATRTLLLITKREEFMALCSRTVKLPEATESHAAHQHHAGH